MNAATQPDGDLPGALARLEDAINQLIEPQWKPAGRPDCPNCHNPTCEPNCRQHTCPGHHTETQPLYMQLWDATPTEHIHGRRELAATAVTWTDALRIRLEIDTAVEIAQPQYHGTPPTVGRLRCLRDERKWRPQDSHWITTLAAALESFAEDITKLLNPQPQWALTAACPACSETTVYRHDSAGERVRQPALQIGPQGCYCAACKYTWGAERFEILAAALRYETPKGATRMTVAELIAKLSTADPDMMVVTDDSTSFHYITKFDVCRVPAAISDTDSPLGPFIQRFNPKQHKGEPVDVIVLTQLGTR